MYFDKPISQLQFDDVITFLKKDVAENTMLDYKLMLPHDNEKLAKSIQNSLNETIEKEKKREPSKISGVYIVDNVTIPLSIVECGFLSNPEEEALLQTDEYQNKLAWAIYTGIMNYFYN